MDVLPNDLRSEVFRWHKVESRDLVLAIFSTVFFFSANYGCGIRMGMPGVGGKAPIWEVLFFLLYIRIFYRAR